MARMLQSQFWLDIIVPGAASMFVFGHMGIALAGALLLDAVIPGRHCAVAPKAMQPMPLPETTSSGFLSVPAARLKSLADRVDIRILFLGALIPDIIDKPIGRVFFRETFDNGRIFAHTLLFLALVTIVGLYLYKKRGSSAGLVLSFGVLTHLLLDAMWFRPQALFWPLLGLSFGEYPTDLYSWSGIQEVLEEVMANPVMTLMALPEVIGALVLMWFVFQVLRVRRVHAFMRYGRL